MRDLAETKYVAASGLELHAVAARVAERLGEDGTHRIVLVDGVPVLAGAVPDGVEIRAPRLLSREPARLEPYLGRIARPEFFGAINAALFTDGVVVFVEEERTRHDRRSTSCTSPRTVRRPRWLIHACSSSPKPVASSRSWRRCSDATKARTSATRSRRSSSARTRTSIHVSVHQAKSHHVVRQAVRLDRDARYEATSVTLGGGLVRVDLHVILDGENAEISLDGVYLVSGEDLVDHHVLVEHRAQRCT